MNDKRDKQGRPSTTADRDIPSFTNVVEEALIHFGDPIRLGKQSPLAAPYLIYDKLDANDQSAETRGLALRALLRDHVTRIKHPKPKIAQRYRRLIEGYYFQGHTEKEVIAKDLDEEQPLSHSSFHDNRKAAIGALSNALTANLKPALRLEAPPHDAKNLIGRQRILVDCAHELGEGKTVLISGAGGIGKTTLASRLAHQWDRGPVFWFTVRPGLNDQLGSLLFELGHFLQQCGQPLLWSTLVACVQKSGKLNDREVMGIVRRALADLQRDNQMPLLCFDEFDLLQTEQRKRHADLMRFVEQLNGWAPVLLIGQQVAVKVDSFHKLEGLTQDELRLMLQAASITLPLDDERAMHEYTRGNTRLLELFVILQQTYGSLSTSLSDLIRELKHVSPLKFLLNRILKQLTPIERSILMDLSVQRSWAPIEVWQTTDLSEAIQSLQERSLVKFDDRGGVAMLPVFRRAIAKELQAETRSSLHIRAAAIHVTRGNDIEAAYHLVRAGRIQRALQLWLERRDVAINQGQVGAALLLFTRMRSGATSLAPEVRDKINLELRSLLRLLGKPREALKGIPAMLSDTPLLQFEEAQLEGVIANDLSDFDRADKAFRRGLKIASQLVGVGLVYIHKGRAWMHMRNREMDHAWQEVQLARYEYEHIAGDILDARCEYEDAITHYTQAIALAEESQDQRGIAKSSMALSGVFARQLQLDQAKAWQARADQAITQMGLLIELHRYKTNWAFILNLCHEYTPARRVLLEGMSYLAQSGAETLSWVDALFNQNMAEAQLGLGNLDEALHCLEHVIQLEEIDILPDAFRTYGEVMFKYGRLDEAVQWIQRSVELCERNDDDYLAALAQRALALVYFAQGDPTQAKAAIDSAIALFTRIRLDNEVRNTLLILIQR